MVYCAAFGCKNKAKKGTGISFFQFPTDSVLLKAWIHHIRRKNFTPSKHSRVCSVHFSPESFERSSEDLARYGYVGGRNRLKSDAVPTLVCAQSANQGENSDPNSAAKSVDGVRSPRGAFLKRRHNEILAELLVNTNCPDESTEVRHDCETSQDVVISDPTDSSATGQGENLETIPIIIKRTNNMGTQANFKSFRKMRTRQIQVRPVTREMGVQVDFPQPIGNTREEEPMSTTDNFDSDSDDDDNMSCLSNDPDYEPISEDSESESDGSDDELLSHGNLTGNSDPEAERYFLVGETALCRLFAMCQICTQPMSVQVKRVFGTMLTLDYECANGHKFTWKSQREINRMPLGNIQQAAAILFSGCSVAKALTCFRHLNVPSVSERTYYRLQKNYLIPAVSDIWKFEQTKAFTEVEGTHITVGGDGRCDSPGYSAKYGSYTLMDLKTKKILETNLVQCNEVRSSCHMELEGLKRALSLLETNGCVVEDLVTDRHSQIKKFMREQKNAINHYFDVWHVSKGVTKKLEKQAKLKKYADIQPWIKGIGTHLYFIAASCGDDGQLKLEKWLSILNHVINVHEGHSDKYPACDHGELEKERPWLKKGSKPYKILEGIVKQKLLLKDIPQLSPKHQTYSLEVFHNVVNHFASKQQHYFFDAMQARVYLAALHFNENSDLEQRRSKEGELLWTVSYPKAKKGASPVAKPVKQRPSYGYVSRLLSAVFERRYKLTSYQKSSWTEPTTPKPLTHNFPVADKAVLVQQRKSRFVTFE